MANLQVKDAAAATQEVKATGVGSAGDPFITEHLETNSAAILAAVQAIQTAVEILDNFVSGSEAQVDVLTSALPSGAATAANQATANTALAAIQAAVEILDNIVSGAEAQVDVVSSALPSGAATEATLAAIQTAVELIDNMISGAEAQVDVVTSALPSGAATEATLASALTALQLIDNMISGNEAQVDIVTMPALDRTTDNVGAVPTTGVIMDDTTAVTVKRAVIAASGSGDNTLVAAVSAKKIRVVFYDFVVAGAVTVRFESGASGTALTGQMAIAANGGKVNNFNPAGWFETATNTLLNMELSAAVSVAGVLGYIEVD